MQRAAMVAVHHPGGFILAAPARHRSSPLIAEQMSEGQPGQPAPKVDPYAWVIVAVLAVTLTIASGARFLFGVVLKPVSEQFGWDRAQLTGAVMVGMIVISICQPIIGILVDRIGPKKILVAGLLLLGLSLIPLSMVTQLWQVYLVYGIVMPLGLAAASPVLSTAIVGRWFQEKRGLAMSIATSGSAFGQLLIVPIATWIMVFSTWEMTYRIQAVAILAVSLPLSMILLRDNPAAGTAAAAADQEGMTLREAVSNPAFWILGFGFIVCGWTMAFPNTHFMAYADDMGMSVLHAANAISVTAIFSVLGSVLLGMAADRYDRSHVLGLTYALRGLAFLLLILLPGGNLIYLYGLVLGISWTATTPLTAAIAADRYGPRHLGLIFGSLFTFMNLGFGVGSFLDGVIYENLGGYNGALAINVILGVIGAGLVLLLPRLAEERGERWRGSRMAASPAD
jgi:MFS family permease